jgi:4-azaleucine resistance transporter AzlC
MLPGQGYGDFRLGAMAMLPMTVGAAPFGMMIGAMAAQAGLSPAEAILMSGAVFAGASQFVALDMWNTASFAAIVGVTLLVNLRHVLMGAAVAPHLRALPPLVRHVFLYVMADENWAFAMRKVQACGGVGAAYLMGLTLPFYLNWVAWTAAGTQVGRLINDPRALGFDFVFIAVCLTLLVGFWRGNRRLLPIVAAAAVAVVSQRLLSGNWYILFGGLAGAAAAWVGYRRKAEPDGPVKERAT